MSDEELRRLRGPAHRKVFVSRDYSHGSGVRFQKKLPDGLFGLIEESVFQELIADINARFEEAEALSAANVCQSIAACLTAYLAYLCVPSSYEKALARLSDMLAERNKLKLLPLNLAVVDPRWRGFRVLEFQVFGPAAAVLNDSSLSASGGVDSNFRR